MKQERDVKPTESIDNPGDEQSIVKGRETILPSPIFCAVIAITCACILLIM